MKTPCHIRTRVPRLLAYLERRLQLGSIPWPLPGWVHRLPKTFPRE
jgi:hypothetical protein